MEIHEALEFCLRRLQAEPERLRRLALSLARPGLGAPEEAAADLPAGLPGGAQGNRAVLQASQEILAETLARLGQENS